MQKVVVVILDGLRRDFVLLRLASGGVELALCDCHVANRCCLASSGGNIFTWIVLFPGEMGLLKVRYPGLFSENRDLPELISNGCRRCSEPVITNWHF